MDESSLRFTKDHTWICPKEEGFFNVGISDYAQRQLGDILFVELPQVGKLLKTGDVLAVVESVKSASEVYMPLDGEVVDINNSLPENPEYINQSPYEDGWIAKIKPSESEKIEELLSFEKYQEFTTSL